MATSGGRPISLVVGPGQHGHQLASALEAQGRGLWVARRWPILEISYAGETYRSRPYDLARRTAWALWRRIPFAGQVPMPKHAELAAFDAIVARHLPDSCLFVGWSQVALKSMRKARLRDTPVVLEHPMIHVDAWTRVLREECERWGCRASSCHGWFSGGLIERMKAEYELADAISVPSSYAASSFALAGFGASRLSRTPLGVDTEVFRPAFRRPPGPLRVLYVGRLDLLKGVQYLLKAIQRLRFRSTELVLAGHLLPELKSMMKSADIPNLRLLGDVPKAELAALYRTADVLAFPTLIDAFGLVILEAMASGVPVVATSCSGGPDVIQDGHDGLLVPAGDAEALAGAIDRLLSDASFRLAMGSAARLKAESCSWQAYADAIRSTHGQLMARADRARQPVESEN